ncbi:CDP-diacylglycerol phosphotidylhydrolase [Erwinia piriflorinigrans CFBP 5888]|uniref:CDP-diacylglycerol pyrophosphatase n=2 Tax=Erwinia piriflorinigrans TaxID=665097 RepID=V5Z3J3_9GAMM|nr:CDP-diacylglycerol phosphotidylhydrolase [Erwinia piriflorinigrans CFBP 5888]
MMQKRKRVITVLIVFVGLITLSLFCIALNYNSKSDKLWQIISQQCIPEQQFHGHPEPCRQVNIANGYVVMKDQNGPLQFLLMPVAKISGIESQKLQNPATPNFFSEAWRARHFMEEKRGVRIDDSNYSLAINSRWGRSQNQLHIHISCLRPDIRQRLDALSSTLNATWQTHQLGEHEYQLRVVTRDEFKRTSPFIRLANELPGARDDMGSYGMAVAALGDGKRVLMVVKRHLLSLNLASAEELQDHSCALLK